MVTRSSVGSTQQLRDNIGVYNIYDYGARTNNANNINAINACLAAAPNSRYTIIMVPAGQFQTSGFNLGSRTLIGPGTLVHAPTSTVPLVTLENSASIYGIQLDGNSVLNKNTNNHIISIEGSATRIFDVSLLNAWVNGIRCPSNINPAGLMIDNVRLSGYSGDGITIEGGTDISISKVSLAFSSLSIPGTGNGIVLRQGSIPNPILRVSLSDITCISPKACGILAQGLAGRTLRHLGIYNCKINLATDSAIKIQDAQGVIITANIAETSNKGIVLQGDVQYSTVSANLAANNTTNGIMELVSGATPNNNKFVGNTTYGNTPNTIAITGAQSMVVA